MLAVFGGTAVVLGPGEAMFDSGDAPHVRAAKPSADSPAPGPVEPSPSPSDEPVTEEPSATPTDEDTADGDDTGEDDSDCSVPPTMVEIPEPVTRERLPDGRYKLKMRHHKEYRPGYNFCTPGLSNGSAMGGTGQLPAPVPTNQANQPGWPRPGQGGSGGTGVTEDNRVPIDPPHGRGPGVTPVRPPAPAPRVPVFIP